MTRIIVDTSELQDLAAQLRAAGERIGPAVRPVVSRGALGIKRQLSDEMSQSRHFKGVAASISYDLDAGPGYVEAVVGPDKDRAGGGLANIAYFGGSGWGGGHSGGTVPDPMRALEAEAPRLEAAMLDVLRDLL